MAATRNSQSSDLLDVVAASLLPRLLQGQRVCVALSGGRDSVALLHILAELRASRFSELKLSAVHVHHGLSANADAWAEFCADLCRQLNVPFRCERVVVDRVASEGLEAAARAARYACFSTCGEAVDWLALAHHRDDQAETLLLNLLRGAGTYGLAAMPEVRPLHGAGLSLIRPLLLVPRKSIEAYLTARSFSWVEDESNTDNALRRNFIRHTVMPAFDKAFPDPSLTLSRAAAHLAEQAALAEEVAEADAIGIVDRVAGLENLRIAPFNQLSSVRRTNLLRYFLRRLGLRMPDSRYLAEMLRQLAHVSSDNGARFMLDGATLQVSRICLWRVPDVAVSPGSVALEWHGELSLPWGGGIIHFVPAAGHGVAARVIEMARCELRLRRGGERLRTDLRRPRRSLKKILQELDMPQWQRDSMPLLWCGDELLWVADVGYARDSPLMAYQDEAGWEIFWEPVGGRAPARNRI